MSSDDDSLNNHYISDEDEAPKKKRKPKKDPNKPKRNMSAFFLYSNANRDRVKEENPGVAFGQIPPSDDEEVTTKKRKKKDPNAPKRNMSAYFIYSQEMRPVIKEEHPDASFGETAKLISARFKELSAAERKKYDDLALADKERYQREMRIFKGEESE